LSAWRGSWTAERARSLPTTALPGTSRTPLVASGGRSVGDYPLVVVGKDIISPGSYPDVYPVTASFSKRHQVPAAGADISLSVHPGTYWSVKTLTALFTASANAANRLVGFFVQNQDGQKVYQYQT